MLSQVSVYHHHGGVVSMNVSVATAFRGNVVCSGENGLCYQDVKLFD